jgi:hypothetical protein
MQDIVFCGMKSALYFRFTLKWLENEVQMVDKSCEF